MATNKSIAQAVVISILLLSLSVSSSPSSSSSSSFASSSGYEIHIPAHKQNAHVIIHPMMPLNIRKLWLEVDLLMTQPTPYPFFLSYAVPQQPNELALGLPGSAEDKAYTLLMGGHVASIHNVTTFPIGGIWTVPSCVAEC